MCSAIECNDAPKRLRVVRLAQLPCHILPHNCADLCSDSFDYPKFCIKIKYLVQLDGNRTEKSIMACYDRVMKLHLITVGEPKLAYARSGWEEYRRRLQHYHQVQVTHISDKYAYDTDYILKAAGNSYKVALVIDGAQFSSPELAAFLEKRALEGRVVSLLIGGPEGLPEAVRDAADFQWSFSKLTFPHDLAMVILLESLYRASTISAGQPYHK